MRRTIACLGLCVAVALAVSGCAGAAPNTVRVHDLAFDPQNMTVPVGTTVTWVVDEETAVLPRTADFGASGVDQSLQWTAPKPLNPGETFTHTFDKAGVYHIVDGIQPYCTGTITVQ